MDHLVEVNEILLRRSTRWCELYSITMLIHNPSTLKSDQENFIRVMQWRKENEIENEQVDVLLTSQCVYTQYADGEEGKGD